MADDHLDNFIKPDYPMLTPVYVNWHHTRPDGFRGKIVYEPRWTTIGWEARVLPDHEAKALWIPADGVSPISAVELLGDLSLIQGEAE